MSGIWGLFPSSPIGRGRFLACSLGLIWVQLYWTSANRMFFRSDPKPELAEILAHGAANFAVDLSVYALAANFAWRRWLASNLDRPMLKAHMFGLGLQFLFVQIGMLSHAVTMKRAYGGGAMGGLRALRDFIYGLAPSEPMQIALFVLWSLLALKYLSIWSWFRLLFATPREAPREEVASFFGDMARQAPAKTERPAVIGGEAWSRAARESHQRRNR